ncbi:MAG: hypothetical protein K0Q69_3535, partial [Devosia sp.]|nr:hypothetical protein [Devosia sp.]
AAASADMAIFRGDTARQKKGPAEAGPERDLS